MSKEISLTRRDFLRLAMAAGGAVLLSPVLEACNGTRNATPTLTATLTPTALLDGLDGLDVDTFFEEAYRRWLVRDPEILTQLGLADAYGVGDGNLTNISDEFIRETQALEVGTLDLLQAYEASKFTPEQALTADIYEWFLDDLVRGHSFMYDDYPVNPIVTSVHYNLYSLFTIYHPLNNRQDADDYLARLSQVGTKIAQLCDGLERRRQSGVVLPAFIIPIVLDDINGIARSSPVNCPFYTTFVQRLNGVSETERQELQEQVEAQVKSTVIPAYQELADTLTDLQADAPTAIGVWQFDDGAAYYSQSLRRHTTIETTADAIHNLGKEQVERIHAEMRPLFSELGYPEGGSISSLFGRLTDDSGVYSGQAAVQAYEEAIRSAEALLPLAFEKLPQAEVKVVGGTEGDYYVSPPYDGSRPGIFYARTNSATPRFGVKSLVYHETVPGHHLQIALAQEIPGLPALRRGMQFLAHAEGWALYAERLMWELGAYEDDPQGNLGRLQMEVFRAARLVVDTGIHSKRWSFDQAVNYLSDATGYPMEYAQREITRYSVWPGQAASYYMGFLKILELRQKAKDALGERFDLRAFHGAVLENGSVPLSVLEGVVDSYIAGAM